jgi:hypothetical protein
MNVGLSNAIYLSAVAETRRLNRYTLLTRAILAASLLSSPLWLAALFFTSPEDYSYATSLVFVPLVGLGCTLMFTFVWREDRPLRALLGAGVLFRLAAASVYIWVGYVIYNSAVDSFHYWDVGLQLANDFAMTGWSVFKPPYWSSNLISNICGLLSLVIGDALPTLFVIFALASLWGSYFFYRAFRIAFPNGDHRLYGLLVIFFPSIAFWSSAIGKDALEQLFIGLSAYGFARLIQRPGFRASLICIAGIAGAILSRPHVGAIVTLACLLPYTLAGTRGHWMRVSAKILIVPVLLLATVYLAVAAGNFVGMEAGDAEITLQRVDQITKSTQIGGSAFNAEQSLPARIAMAPFLMFRPLPWAIAFLEAFALLIFCVKRRNEFKAALRRCRTPYIAFILIFSAEFSLAFAATVSNFGILVRQRIMLLPLMLMLFCANLSKSGSVSVAAGAPRGVASLMQRTEP